MPGNEVGDRVHNFFEQGNLSQDEHHTQLGEGNWPVFNNNLWGGSDRQFAGTLNSKNYSVAQSDTGRGQGGQFALGSHGLNFIQLQSNLRPEFVKNVSQLPQVNLNGYMHSSQVVPSRQNETNFLGVDTEPDRYLTSRGHSILESQQRSGLQDTNLSSFRGADSPMNFNFLGGQQQMSGQQPGMLQSLPRQQSVTNDTQLLQQQVMFKQMQEFQRQQHLLQLEARQKNAASQMSPFPSQMSGQHPSAINGNALHDASNYPLPSQVVTGKTNWPQREASSAVQGYSNGIMITPEQGQAMRFMGLMPQQASQSLYGVPASNSHTTNAYSDNNVDKLGVLQVPASGGSFSGSQYTPFPEQVPSQDRTTVSKCGSEGKSSFELASSQSFGNVVDMRIFNQLQRRNVPISEGGRHDSASGTELVPEKSATQPAPSQAAVGLDPTEEKILFGNDESIWEAFGGSSVTGTGGVSRLDGTDLLNRISSVQSGTWSALMQSAVAETSSSGTGMQEEWSGFGSQNSRMPSGYQSPSVLHDNEKKQSVWVDSSQTASLGPQSASNDVSTTNYLNNSGLHQPFPNLTGSQIMQEGGQWLDRNQPNPQAEQNRALESANSSVDCSKTDSGYWSHQRTIFLPHNSGQVSSRSSALNFIESLPANGSVASTNQDSFCNNVLNMDAGRGAAMRLGSSLNSNVEFGSPPVNSMNNVARPSLSSMKVNQESSQKLPDDSRLDLWKPVNSSLKSGSEVLEKDQPNLNKGPSILESSVSISDGGTVDMHESENGGRRENLNGSYHSTDPQHVPPSCLSDNVLPGCKEKPYGQSGKKVPVTRKFQYHPMGDVDTDESSYAAKHVLHSQPMSQHLSSVVKGHETQPRFLGPSSTNLMDNEKDNVFTFQGAVRASHGVSSSGINPEIFPNTSAAFVRSGDISSSSQHKSSSQNMLELLHKVDQSKEQNVDSHLSFSGSNRLHDITSCGPDGFNQSQSSTSHGFSLQLAPPSQGVAPSSIHSTSQSSPKPIDTHRSDHLASDKGDKVHAWLGSVSSAQCLPPPYPPSQMQSGGNKPGLVGSMDADRSLQNLKGKLSTPLVSSSPLLSNPLQNQHMTGGGGRMFTNKSAGTSFDNHARYDCKITDSQDQAANIQSVNYSHHNLASGWSMNHSGMRAFMHQMPVTSAAAMPGMSRKDNVSPLGANLWNSQHHLSGAQGHNASDLLKSSFPSNVTSEISSSTQQKKFGQDDSTQIHALSSQVTIGRDEPSVAEGRPTERTAGASQEEEPGHTSDASPSISSASEKDLETSHHSLKSNCAANDSYSLLHQMQAMKSAVTDPCLRESKRLKGPDNGPDAQQTAGKAAQPSSGGVNDVGRDPSINRTLDSVGDARTLSFVPQSGNRSTSFQFPHGAFSSQDMLSFGRNDLQKFPGNFASRFERTGVSPQMAPSWFEQYGTLKNGQLLPVRNMPAIPVNKNVEQQFNSEKSPNSLVAHSSVQAPNLVAGTVQITNTCQIMTGSTPSERVSSLDALVPHASAQSLASSTPLKRKTSTWDLLPWNKEIEQGIKRLQSMSLAEIDWAQSSNRLIEKVEDETDASEDLLPLIKPKRRLILTAQLIQQVFRSPSAAVLSLDASSNYEIIMYSLSRLALGDACSSVCCIEGDPPVHPASGNSLSEKVKALEIIRDQYFSKVTEAFCEKAKELDNDILRLEKHASILDFRLDCQDLERFSVINRFARFHGRGQVDGAETSSSSDATAMAQKPYPQRYVSAHPMPRTLPERVQCLSL